MKYYKGYKGAPQKLIGYRDNDHHEDHKEYNKHEDKKDKGHEDKKAKGKSKH